MEVTAKDHIQPIREMVLVNAQTSGISFHVNQVDTQVPDQEILSFARMEDPRVESARPQPALTTWPVYFDIELDQARGWIYGSDSTGNKVDVISTSTLLWVKSFALVNGANPKGIGLSPDGRELAVAQYGASSLLFINPDTGQTVASLTPNSGIYGYGRPLDVIYGRSGRLYISGESDYIHMVDTTTLNSQLRFGNASSSQVTVHIYVGGIEVNKDNCTYGYPYLLAVGASLRVNCTGTNGGAVKIVSTGNIVAGKRILYDVTGATTSFSETMGLPNSLLTTTYWMPLYNNVDLDMDLILGVSGSTTSGGQSFSAMNSDLSQLAPSSDLSSDEESLDESAASDPDTVTIEDGSPLLQALPISASQDSVVTFTNVHAPASEQRFSGAWDENTIEVLYEPLNQRIQLWTYSFENDWVQSGEDIPVSFADGDVFRARALPDGTVEIYQNGDLLVPTEADFLSEPDPAQVLSPESVSYNQPAMPQLKPVSYLAADPHLGLPDPPLQQMSELNIDYTYDALNRLLSATYSDGRSFGYTYDAAGNVQELQKNLGPGTVVTTYTYDAANQLETATGNGVEWQYAYDANGSLIETLPNGNQASGAKRYSYNAAGYLVEVEAHNGTAWDVQAEMDYNGLGQRLSMDAAGVIAHYVMDGDQPLAATSGSNTTLYLYGMGPIAEKSTDWEYSLPDGVNTPRQLANLSGAISLLGRYTPWGDILEVHGTGSFTFGYLGGVILAPPARAGVDAATGLLYVGNGQYYDLPQVDF